MDINKTLAKEFGLKQEQVDNTVALIDDDKTIPFIARYRKELTGSLDDQILRARTGAHIQRAGRHDVLIARIGQRR